MYKIVYEKKVYLVLCRIISNERRIKMTLKLFNTIIHIKKEIIAVIAIFMLMLLALIGYLISKGGDEVIIYAGDSENSKNADLGVNSINPKEDKLSLEKNRKNVEDRKSIENEDVEDIESIKSVEETEKIKVYIIGCVNNPGIITLEKGQMIYEAIEAAGGATKEADIENINMVYKLEENVMLNILPKDKIKIKEEGQNRSIGDKNIESDSSKQSGIQIIRDEGYSVIYASGTSDKEDSFENLSISKKVNINTASIAELDTLPGIGIATAESIIKYRQQYGKFDKIEDIMNVSGIKENKFEKIKEFITVK